MQVKFRGKRVDGQGWVVGSLITSDFNVSRKDYYIRLQSWDDVHGYLTYPVVPESVGMFTGLTDKNGKEIYGAVGEKGGDVVKFTANWGDYMGHIEYGIIGEDGEKHAAFGYYVIRGGVKESFYLSLMDINATGTEIIGNATDNPELLNQ